MPFREMEIPVLFNCLGREMGPEDTIPALLEKQVQTSVYMEDTIRRLAELGVDTIVEIGPGKALSAFVKKTENMRLVPDWAYKLVIGERIKI